MNDYEMCLTCKGSKNKVSTNPCICSDILTSDGTVETPDNQEDSLDYIIALKIFRNGYWPNKPKGGQGFEWWCEQKIKETGETPDNQEEEITSKELISKIKKRFSRSTKRQGR